MIESISVRNFRGIEERLLQFGKGVNYLRGPNEAGKTSIAEAIFFALTGTDSTGLKNPDHLITEGVDVCEVALKTHKACFLRKKKREETSTIQLLRDGFPPLKLNQTELTKLLMMDVDLLGSCFMVGYFMRLPDDRKLQVIAAAAKLDRFSILDNLMGNIYKRTENLPKNVKLVNPRIDADAVARDRRVLANQLANDEGALSMADAELMRLTGEDIDEESYQKQVNELNAKVALHDKYRVDLALYEQQLARAKEAEHYNANIDNERKKYQEALEQLGPRPTTTPESFDEKIAEFQAEKGQLVTKYKTRPVMESFIAVNPGLCDRCEQPVSNEYVEKRQSERIKKIEEFNKLEREVADYNAQVKEREDYLSREIQHFETQKLNARTQLHHWDVNKKDFDDKLARLKPVQVQQPAAPQVPDGDVALMKQELVRLQTELSVYRLNKTKRAELERKRTEIRAAADTKIEAIGKLKKLEEALRILPEKEVEETAEKLKLANAKVALREGMLYVFDQKGIPYQSLSRGRRMKIDIEWCKRFQALHSPSPGFYFLDDADLLDTLTENLPEGTQVFVAKVDPTIKELQVVQM